MNKKNIVYIFAIVVGLVFLANGLILAWTAPAASPPGGNVTAPLNVGGTEQSKTGRLGVATTDADDDYGLTVGTSNDYGIKSDKFSWFGGGLRAADWQLSNDRFFDDGELVIATYDEYLRLNSNGNFSNGILIHGDAKVNRSLTVDGNITAEGQNVCRQNGVNCPTASTNCGSCDARFVNTSGDTMTDDLAAPRLVDSSNSNYYVDPNGPSVLRTVYTTQVIDSDNNGYYLNPNSISVLSRVNAGRVDSPIIYDKDNTGYYMDPNGTSKFYRMFITGCRICLGWADRRETQPSRTACHPLNSMVRDNSNFVEFSGNPSDDDRLWVWFECD